METGYGDRLARGADSAIFGANGKVTQKQWDNAFEGFDPEEFKKGGKDGGRHDNKERTRI